MCACVRACVCLSVCVCVCVCVCVRVCVRTEISEWIILFVHITDECFWFVCCVFSIYFRVGVVLVFEGSIIIIKKNLGVEVGLMDGPFFGSFLFTESTLNFFF